MKDIEKSGAFDLSKVVDLYDEEGMFEEISPDNLVIEDKTTSKEEKIKTGKKVSKKELERRRKEAEETFSKEYKKMGGIQHIICSATMTIDNTGRITPK